MAPNYLEHALAKFEKISQTFDTILAQIFLGTRSCDTDILATWQLPVHSPKPHNFHTQTTGLSRGNKSYTAILPKFAKICALSALEQEQKKPCHVLDCGWHAQCTLARAPALIHAARAPCRAFKGHPRTRNTSLRACPHFPSPVLSSCELCTARQANRALGRRGQLFPTTPSLALAPGQLPRAAEKLSQAWAKALPHRRSKHDLTGLWPTATSRGPSHSVSHFSIPCTHTIADLPWRSSSAFIWLYRREQVGACIAGEPDRLRTRPAHLWPPPPTIRTSTWSPETPGPHPTLRWTSTVAGKPRHRLFSFGHYSGEGGARVRGDRKLGG
jgi:hypothetical protein